MFKNPIKEIEKFMENAEQWLKNITDAVVTIAKGNPLDQATKDKVAELNEQMTTLTNQLRDNDAKDAGQQEAAEALQKAIEAIVKQLAEAPAPAEPEKPTE